MRYSYKKTSFKKRRRKFNFSSFFVPVKSFLSEKLNKKKSFKKRRRSLKSSYGYSEKEGFYFTFRKVVLPKLFFVLIGVQFYLLFFSSYFSVNYINLNDISSLEKLSVEKIVNKYLAKRQWFIFPHDNIFVFSEEALAKEIEQEYNLESFSISKHLLDRNIELMLTERDPVAVFSDNNRYFLIDSLGYVVQETFLDKIDLSFPLIYNETLKLSNEAKVGAKILEEGLVETISKLHYQVPVETGLKIASYKIRNAQQFEIIEKEIEKDKEKNSSKKKEEEEEGLEEEEADLYEVEIIEDENFFFPELIATTTLGTNILFGHEPLKKKGDVEKQIESLIVLVKNDDSLTRRKLEYIDLRFITKIFYK